MKKKIFVPNYWPDGWDFIDGIMVSNPEDADVIIFPGGSDVNPSLYGCENTHSGCSLYRDEYELRLYNNMKPNQVAFGVCRGMQFLTAMNGGIMIQDVTSHAIGLNGHSIKGTNEKYPESFDKIPSLHHQMCYPYDLPEENYEVIYVSSDNRSSHYYGDKIDEQKINKIRTLGEPEMVLYHTPGKPKCVCIQGHPEMIGHYHPIHDLINQLINQSL